MVGGQRHDHMARRQRMRAEQARQFKANFEVGILGKNGQHRRGGATRLGILGAGHQRANRCASSRNAGRRSGILQNNQGVGHVSSPQEAPPTL